MPRQGLQKGDKVALTSEPDALHRFLKPLIRTQDVTVAETPAPAHGQQSDVISHNVKIYANNPVTGTPQVFEVLGFIRNHNNRYTRSWDDLAVIQTLSADIKNVMEHANYLYNNEAVQQTMSRDVYHERHMIEDRYTRHRPNREPFHFFPGYDEPDIDQFRSIIPENIRYREGVMIVRTSILSAPFNRDTPNVTRTYSFRDPDTGRREELSIPSWYTCEVSDAGVFDLNISITFKTRAGVFNRPQRIANGPIMFWLDSHEVKEVVAHPDFGSQRQVQEIRPGSQVVLKRPNAAPCNKIICPLTRLEVVAILNENTEKTSSNHKRSPWLVLRPNNFSLQVAAVHMFHPEATTFGFSSSRFSGNMVAVCNEKNIDMTGCILARSSEVLYDPSPVPIIAPTITDQQNAGKTLVGGGAGAGASAGASAGAKEGAKAGAKGGAKAGAKAEGKKRKDEDNDDGGDDRDDRGGQGSAKSSKRPKRGNRMT